MTDKPTAEELVTQLQAVSWGNGVNVDMALDRLEAAEAALAKAHACNLGMVGALEEIVKGYLNEHAAREVATVALSGGDVEQYRGLLKSTAELYLYRLENRVSDAKREEAIWRVMDAFAALGSTGEKT